MSYKEKKKKEKISNFNNWCQNFYLFILHKWINNIKTQEKDI